MARLEDLLSQWGMNDLSGSEVGMFFDRTFVSKFLLFAFDISGNQVMSNMIKRLVADLSADLIQELKAELELYLQSSGAIHPSKLNVVLAKILHEAKFQNLCADLVKRKIIQNVGGYAHMKLRIWN